MRFVVDRQALLDVAPSIQNMVTTRPVLPILSHVLIEATQGGLEITVTDLTVGVRCIIPAEVSKQGSATVSARRFLQLIRELSTSQLQLHAPGSVTEVSSGPSRFKLHGLQVNDFPKLPSLKSAVTVDIPQAVLKKALWLTSFAVAREDSRYTLMGLFLGLQGGVATLVGTDGKRLARTELQLNLPSDFSGNFTLPLKAVEEMQKMLSDSDETARLHLMTDRIGLEVGGFLLVSKLLTGDFPNFDRVIPKSCPIRATIDREELMALLRQIALFTTEQNQAVQFSFQSGELTLEAANGEVGEGRVSMPIQLEGKGLTIAFNPAYLLDILRHLEGESFSLQLTDAFNPGVITDSHKTLFILMPMRLQNETS